MLLSVTFDKIATLVWTFYWAHKFVAHWIRYSCVYFYLWPFRVRFGLWPFRFVAVPVCGRSGLWPFRFVAVSVCGRLGFGRYGLWPLWPESMWKMREITNILWFAFKSVYYLASSVQLMTWILLHVLASHPLERLRWSLAWISSLHMGLSPSYIFR